MKKVFPVKLLGLPRFTSHASKWFSIKYEKISKNAFSLLKTRNSCLEIPTHFVQEQNQAIHSLKQAFRQHILHYDFFILTKNHFQVLEADFEL